MKVGAGVQVGGFSVEEACDEDGRILAVVFGAERI